MIKLWEIAAEMGGKRRCEHTIPNLNFLPKSSILEKKKKKCLAVNLIFIIQFWRENSKIANFYQIWILRQKLDF